MSKLIDSIVGKNFIEADSILSEAVELIMARKLEEAKKMTAAKMAEQQGHVMNRRAAKLRVMDIAEMGGSSGLVVPKSNSSEKSSLPSNTKLPKQTPEDKEVDDIINKNTKGIINRKEKGMLPSDYPVTVKMEETEEQLDEARVKIVKARIRGGKIQRRKRVSNVPGMTIRGGKLTRMSPAERRRRKMGQRRGKIKRKAKMNRAMMKRQRSIRKRKALGL